MATTATAVRPKRKLAKIAAIHPPKVAAMTAVMAARTTRNPTMQEDATNSSNEAPRESGRPSASRRMEAM